VCSFVRETTSELESHDLIDPIICWCRKHQHLAHQEGAFVACFTLNILMVYSLKPVVVTDGSNLASVKHAWGETIRFEILDIIADRFDNLIFSPEGNESGTVFMGMAHSGLPSLHAILKESVGEDESTLSERGSFGFPTSQDCNVVIPTVPIVTTPLLEGTLAPLNIPMVPSWIVMPQPDPKLLPERLHAYQEEQQCILQANTERRAAQRWGKLTDK
jgi:hypothetical protein